MNTALIQQPVTGYRSVPGFAGIGLRPQHHAWVIEHRPKVAWFEVHAENFMTRGALLEELEVIAPDYPLSLHAVGLSLGSIALPESRHLSRLRELVTRFEPDLVSDHLSWSAVPGAHLPDLLPLPYTEESLRVVIRNVQHVQDVLKREILLENPSRYLEGTDSTLSEAEFLAEVVLRTGCGILLDVNNLYVSAVNCQQDPATVLEDFLGTLPLESINEIHLAGHSSMELEDGRPLRLDDHGSRVCPEVWTQYQAAIDTLGFVPTLIEWDTRIPPFEVLQEESSLAESLACNTTAMCASQNSPG
jgi:uncharacterized protein